MLAHDDTGTGTPVVLLHGLGSDRRRWDPIRRHLPDDVRCVCIDLPGHGDSLPERGDAASAVGAVHELVDALGLDRPVVVGHSLGAIVTLLCAATFPTRTAIAVDPVGLDVPTFAAALAPYRNRILDGDTVAAFWEFETTHLPIGNVSTASIRQGMTPRPEVIRSYWRGLFDPPKVIAARQPNVAAAVSSIAVPTLVLLADPPSVEDAAVLASMASATVEVWAGTGHWLHLADPRRFARRLVTWLDEHDR
jgi:pimeloyl-ACP methyl ester carboxylesterase